MAKKKNKEITIRSSAAEYLTYVAATGDNSQSFEMRFEDENIWLTQKMLANLYDVEVHTINEHISKIYLDSELEKEATIRNFRIVQTEGSCQVSRNIKHYNLQMIIAVGFKVNNERAVQFRKWANQIVKEYTIKGFAMDDERLKSGGSILNDQSCHINQIIDMNTIHNLDKKSRDEVLRIIKIKTKASNRQLSRVLGIGRDILEKIN